MEFLVTQKNELFDEILKAELDVKSFLIDTRDSSTVFTFAGTNYSFWVGGKFRTQVNYSPGVSQLWEITHANGWPSIRGQFKKWLTSLKREVAVTDKWARLELETAFDLMEVRNNDLKFSENELIELKVRIGQIQEGLKTLPLLETQQRALNDQFEHLIEVSSKMSAKDWKSLVLGSVMGLVLQLGISPEVSHDIWTLIKESFSLLIASK